MKRFIIAFVAGFIFTFFRGWLLNGVLLKDVYAQTPGFPGKLMLYGSTAGVTEMMMTGAIVGAIYKPAVRHM
jgi:hypothetical protein